MRALIASIVLAVALSLPGGSALALSRSAEETRNLALVQSSFEAWSSGSGSPYDLLAENVSWTIVGRSQAARTYPNREAFMGEVIRPFNARMQRGLVPRIRDIYADGDTVIVLFDAEAPAKDGVRYANTYAWFLQFKDGRIVRAHAFFDSIAFDELWRRVRP